MRRLSESEMMRLRRLARDGRKGPKRALDALWDLILREAEGVGLAEASQRDGSFRVQDFAIPRDQAEALLAAMIENRRLPRWEVSRFHLMWVNYSPADYEPHGEAAQHRPR